MRTQTVLLDDFQPNYLMSPNEIPAEVIGEKQSSRLTVTIGPALLAALQAKSPKHGDMSALVKRAIQKELFGVAEDDPYTLLLPLVTAACGPWQEVRDNSDRVVVSRDIAEKFRLRQDDFVVVADGTSMVSMDVRRSIPPGSWIVMRPGINPNNGEVTLYRAKLRDGNEVWTVKHHRRDEQGWVTLMDGMGNTIDNPEDIESLEPVAVKRAVFSQ